ncbi:hypothetical protein ACFQI7_27990 [Paenibacillus allorhizosphaerae]|uniref:DUF5590 domain-containing protein n=1 Tax=Paenibacillus allorhizosphaerae TaxID=2849866 RepID=A0ABN7TQN3_9BACL|nr:hypothetical protein [Paenibacillus allorhizosphaerae]CAG7651632.1 hypothetical protein PAECIP111802_05013 [Paenibacillus allorhizosphaerae]
MRIAIVLVSAWVIVIVGFIIYSHAGPKENKDKKPSAAVSADRNPIISYEQPGGPTDQKKIVQSRKPEDAVKLFFSLINEGKLDGAVSIIEPDYMLLVVSSQKNKAPVEVMHSYVHLFNKGELKSIDFTPPEPSAEQIKATTIVQLNNGTKLQVNFDMYFLDIDGAGLKNWYLKDIRSQKMK